MIRLHLGVTREVEHRGILQSSGRPLHPALVQVLLDLQGTPKNGTQAKLKAAARTSKSTEAKNGIGISHL